MTDLRKAAEMALDAMLSEYSTGGKNKYSPWDVIEALSQALAQPEQKLIGWKDGEPQYVAQPEQEPVAYMGSAGLGYDKNKYLSIPLYTAPPIREWVGLTDEEIKGILDCGRGGLVDIKKAEQILKEKNNG